MYSFYAIFPFRSRKIGSFIICLTSQVEKNCRRRRRRRRRGTTCWTLDRHLIRKISNVSLNTKALNKIKYSKNSVSQQVFFLNLIFLYVVREQSCRFCSIGVEGTNEVKTFGTGWIQLQGQCLGRWYSNVQDRNHLFEPGRKINYSILEYDYDTITIWYDTTMLHYYYTHAWA